MRRIVEGETKVSKLPKMVRSQISYDDDGFGLPTTTGGKPSPYDRAAATNKRDEQAENLRSMFVAMAEDW